MALISCPDCSTEVSDMAAACPKCARPIASQQSTIVNMREPESSVRNTQTVEATGKGWKAQQVIAGFGIVIGFFAMFAKDNSMAGPILGVSLLWWLFARVGSWWNHG